MRLPAPENCQVFIDFDGTITQRDLLDDLIVNCSVNDSWKEIEQLWQDGRIGSRQCLEEQFALLRLDDATLEGFLDAVTLDPGFADLLQLLDRFNIPRAILSDGIDGFIQRTLSRRGLETMLRANAVDRLGLELRLLTPHFRADCPCAAAHCKCASMGALHQNERRSIYIGDGRSDLCPSRKADFVFAKGALAEALHREQRPFAPYQTLADVKQFMERQWLT